MGKAGSSRSLLWLLLLLLCRATTALAAPSTFVYPLDGATDVDSSQAIRWTTTEGALAYYLYVGSSPGAKDIINSGETAATQYPGRSLPAGKHVYARLHTKFASGWQSVDIAFSVRPTAILLSPVSGAVINPNTALQWTSVEGAQAYYLYIGRTPGAKDLVDSGEVQTTSLFATGLPAGTTVYARLHTKFQGAWRSVDATYTVAPVAMLTQPLDGATDVDPRAPLRWTTVPGADAYYLYVGTAPGLKDVVDSHETLATQWPATSLPRSRTLYVRLFTKHGGVWRYVDSQFSLRAVAVFLAPNNGDLAVDPRSVLSWTPVSGAQAYYLYVGTSLGAKDLVNTGETLQLQQQLQTLPRATPLYARLFTKYEDVWRFVDLTFQLTPVAVVTDPLDGATAVDTRRPIRWTAVQGAQAYYLYVGTQPGARDLINSGEIQATQYSIESLPPGTRVYIRLHTKHGGKWRSVDSSIVTKQVAYLTGYLGSTGTFEADKSLAWTPVPGASAYYVYIGSAPGLQDIDGSGEIQATSYTIHMNRVTNLPAAGLVYVTLHTLTDAAWRSVEYTLTVVAKALVSYPLQGSVVDVTGVRLQWTGVSTSQAYYLYVGTQPGLKDVINSGEISRQYWDASTLPGGTRLYARIFTKVDGTWRYADTTFETRAAAALLYPRNGQRSVTLDRPFSWTSVAGATAYRVTFGSTPGATDLYNSGQISGTEVPAPNLPPDGALYGRVWALKGGVWRFSDAIFTREATVSKASIVNPTGQFDAADGIQWDAVPFAASYRVLLGSTPDAADILDTGQIRTVRRYVTGMTRGATIYATLITRFLDRTEARTTTSFVVTQEAVSRDDKLNAVRFLVAEARAMAPLDNVPAPNTVLLEKVRARQHESANCTDYAAALLVLLAESAVGLPSRVLNTCLNPNSFDCHTLVEIQDEDGRWVTADPTFGLLAYRSTDSKLAEAIDIAKATRSLDWSAIDYEFVTAAGTGFATHYYLDYPVLYLNVLAPGSTGQYLLPLESPLSYFESVSGVLANTPGVYAIRCPEGQSSAGIVVNGALTQINCASGLDRISAAFLANTVEIPPDSPAAQILRPRRFVF